MCADLAHIHKKSACLSICMCCLHWLTFGYRKRKDLRHWHCTLTSPLALVLLWSILHLSRTWPCKPKIAWCLYHQKPCLMWVALLSIWNCWQIFPVFYGVCFPCVLCCMYTPFSEPFIWYRFFPDEFYCIQISYRYVFIRLCLLILLTHFMCS